MSTSPVSRETSAAGPETKDLAGRRALVTGGTRGMGAAIAPLLVARGAHVIVTARHREDGQSPVRLIQADLASPEGADFVASEAARILGGLDIVVHCVGASFAKPGGALSLTEDDWMLALGTNLLSAVRLDRAILPGMLEQRSGAIVHVSSLQWKRPDPSSPAYGPAKAALTSYSKVLAGEFGPMGIRVNTSPRVISPLRGRTPGSGQRWTGLGSAATRPRLDSWPPLMEPLSGAPAAQPRWLNWSLSLSPTPRPTSPDPSTSLMAATTGSSERVPARDIPGAMGVRVLVRSGAA